MTAITAAMTVNVTLTEMPVEARDGAWHGTDTGEPLAARSTVLRSRDGVERKFWKQQGGKWVEGP